MVTNSFNMSEDVGVDQIGELIIPIEAFPRLFADSVKDLSMEQLNFYYRQEGGQYDKLFIM